ncbi:MarR family transcriptional regulator [Herbiconiux sp. VKM Ac-1786]|jgi:DNA-binding MarR family transcriptional regulator|uniref:MarR family winged helix-turn-helix transcriptional regulator n=1 Tax=Herbiconiux sp. VKM Ac-1786 TaxID=2783824 RepID=UPI00188AC667|nr:MarR family transcriptional regulator [Herbiconiux sp. VKM Ac-1786]MBF4572887.1 MarR family transcriptional regulator [Herbiconiux sp. VKM Ac-1786]
MTTNRPDSAPHYWYGDDAERDRSIAVLEAMRTFRSAESAMRRRSQESMNMGENDLIAMRYLLRATEQGKTVGPKELAQYLGITSASITVLLDRLEKNGHIHREPSPFDRRALIIVPTIPKDAIEAATLGDVRPELIDVVERLSADEVRIIVDFLTEMREAVDQVDNHQPDRDDRS